MSPLYFLSSSTKWPMTLSVYNFFGMYFKAVSYTHLDVYKRQDKDIQLFKNIKELKNQGFQLKAIKMLIPELISNGGKNMDNLIILKEELNRQVMEQTLKETAMKEVAASTPKAEVKKEPESIEKEIVVVEQSSPVKNMDKGQKMNQFRMILGSMITEVLRENN